MTFEFRVFAAGPKDAKLLSHIEAEAYKKDWSEWEMWYWRKAIDNSYVYKAVVGSSGVVYNFDADTIVGGIIAEPTRYGTIYIDTLVVERAYRGRGIGTALLNQVLSDCDGPIDLRTKATSENLRVLQFYGSRGFVKIDEVADYYEPNTPYVLMRREATKRL